MTILVYDYYIEWYDADLENIKDEAKKKEQIQLYCKDSRSVSTIPRESRSDVAKPGWIAWIHDVIDPFGDFNGEDAFIEIIAIVTNINTKNSNKYRLTFRRTVEYDSSVELYEP